MTTTLNEGEQLVCKILARKRSRANRTAGIRNSKIGGQKDKEIELDGIGGELTFCKLYGLYPDFSIYTRSAVDGTDTFDACLNGVWVDVKTTQCPTGRLLVAVWKRDGPLPDYYALMIGAFPTYEFKGFARSSDLDKVGRLGNRGRGPTWEVLQNKLTFDIPRIDTSIGVYVEAPQPMPVSVPRKQITQVTYGSL